jgi:DNA-binding protein H-NS
MSKLVDPPSQMDKLQKQVPSIGFRAFAKTAQDLYEKMRASGMAVKHLRSSKSPKPGALAAQPKLGRKIIEPPDKCQGTPLLAGHTGPDAETWTGASLTPRWLRTQVAQGLKKEDFLIAQAVNN